MCLKVLHSNTILLTTNATESGESVGDVTHSLKGTNEKSYSNVSETPNQTCKINLKIVGIRMHLLRE
jgi:hypothetical protein